MNRRIHSLATLVACVSVAACSSQPVVQPSPTLQSADPGATLDSLVPAVMAAGDVPGVSIAVVRNGVVDWTGAFGVRSLASGAPVDSNTVFDAASLTKPVFAYAVLRLADRGVIDLDKPIADIRPNDRMKADARYLRITPRMVLAHATGLPNWGGDTLPIAFDPGTDWGYSGEGYVWLSEAVERATGMTLEDVMRREVFEPLGMRHSTFIWNATLEANGSAYHPQFGSARARQPAGPDGRAANAAASLRTTAGDYATFLAAVLAGQGLRPAMARQYLSVQNEAVNAANYRTRPAELRARIAWGLGWGLERRDDRVLFWHWGDNGDAKAFALGDQQTRTAVVYFANSSSGLSIAQAIASAVIPGDAHSLAWLRYEQHDDDRFIARRELVRAGLQAKDNASAAVARAYGAQRSVRASAMTPNLLQSAAVVLGSQRAVDAADTLLALAMRDYPDSVSLAIDRGELHLRASNPAAAIPHFDRAARLAPSDSGARARLEWSTGMVAALTKPAEVDDAVLRRYVGVYGPRTVTFENGRLHYQRGSGRKAVLTPMSEDTFLVEGIPTFRLRFVAEPGAPASRVIGMYHDGTRDGNTRTR